MIYLSKTARFVTEKYIQFAQKGMPGSKILPYDKLIEKQDATKVWFFGFFNFSSSVSQSITVCSRAK